MSSTQQALFGEPVPSITDLVARREDQWFDRKSFRIHPRDLADAMVGFANADGGRIAVGIHGGEVEGVNSSPDHLNGLLQAAVDYTQPPVRHSARLLDCTDRAGNPNRVLVIDIEASEHVHRNQRGMCFLRVGDETRRLGPDEERELVFDKGESVFDGTPARDVTLDDLDQEAIQAYAQRIGASDTMALLRSRGLYLDTLRRQGVTQAGWLLFGTVPPVWSYVRYLRYAGATAETGVRSNLTEDIRLDGNIPSLIEQARQVLPDQIGSVIRLTASGRFERMPALPEFAWLEAVVNAVTHRSYSMQGDGVRVTQFEDRLEVESPGRLPGLVRVENIQNCRFARNPHIARVLAEMTGYVRELNEGVKRMFEEMAQHGLPAPRYTVSDASVRVTLYTQPKPEVAAEWPIPEALADLGERVGQDRLGRLLVALKQWQEMPTRDVAEVLGVSLPTARKHLKHLEGLGLIKRRTRHPRDRAGVWAITDSPEWAGISPLDESC